MRGQKELKRGGREGGKKERKTLRTRRHKVAWQVRHKNYGMYVGKKSMHKQSSPDREKILGGGKKRRRHGGNENKIS